MAILSPDSLSRAVSFVDLNDALLVTQKRAGKERHVEESLAEHQSESEAPAPGDEHKDILIDDVEVTGRPRPPPSTPHDETEAAVAADLAEDELNETGLGVVPAGSEKKKKKKKKSSGANKKPKPTGFEEWYADAPLTAEQHKEEKALYDVSTDFHQRIETCLQRYSARRNLDSVRGNILTKYLILGGVEATPKMFNGGLDKETIQNSTAEEIRQFHATDYVRTGNKKYFDPEEPEHWVVDFESVAKGFFSECVPQRFPLDAQAEVKLYSSVIRNFLNYVLAHEVCPEYNDDVMAAREITNKAETELWALQQFKWAFPGDFNMAASTLYGGRYKGAHKSTQTWELEDPDNAEWNTANPGMSIKQAVRIFQIAVSMEGTEEMYEHAAANDVRIINTENRSFEVVKVVRETPESTKSYLTIKDSGGVAGNIKPLGLLILKHWDGPGLDEEDCSEDGNQTEYTAEKKTKETVFWMEDEILQHVFIGLKLEVRVHELNIGVCFFDNLGGPYCSFYTTMENEKMMNWKEPTPNTRPAPSVDNPGAEEAVFDTEMETDLKEDEKVNISSEHVHKSS